MNSNRVVYLNKAPNDFLKGGLQAALIALPAKLQKAPAKQWIANLNAIKNKGVKAAEIDDCGVLPWLEANLEKTVARDEMLSYVSARQITIKEIQLGSPSYKGYSHANLDPDSQYAELLYVANSERDNVQDRIEEIEWEMEQFNFDLAKLSSNPMAILELESERAHLLREKPKKHEFAAHHFTRAMNGPEVKNLLAHGRELVSSGVYLIEEVQSDWAQKGRRANWVGVSKGPFVTDTKLWAGLVVRRMLQRAAQNPEVQQVAWIRGGMRNGGLSHECSDGLDEFYLKTVSSVVDKAIAKTGQKARLDTISIGRHQLTQVPCIDMTPQVREALSDSLPLYSLAGTWKHPQSMSPQDQLVLGQRCKHLLGSDKHLRFAKRVYDLASMREVAGSFVGRIVTVSLNAQEPQQALDHECYHFASAHLLNSREREIVHRDFAPGTFMNKKVRNALVNKGHVHAAFQCTRSAEEAAAHGFALWAANQLDFGRDPVQSQGIFQQISLVISDACAWFSAFIHQDKCISAEDVFERFASGFHGKKHHQDMQDQQPKWRSAYERS